MLGQVENEAKVSESQPVMMTWQRGAKIAVFLAALWLVFYEGLGLLSSRGAASAAAKTNQIYELAAKKRYSDLQSLHLLGQWALDSLQLMDKEHGAIQNYSIDGSGSALVGRPSWARVLVQRNGQKYVDDVTLLDSVHPLDIVEYTQADYNVSRFDRGLRAPKAPGPVSVD